MTEEELLASFDTGFPLPTFKTAAEAGRYAIDLHEEQRTQGRYLYFVSGGPMHPCPARIAQAIYDVCGVFVLHTAGCEHFHHESSFNAVYNTMVNIHALRDKALSPGLIEAFMGYYYADCGGDILRNPKTWARKYLTPSQDPWDYYDQTRELRRLTDAFRANKGQK